MTSTPTPTTIPTVPTKAEEIAHYTRFVAALPRASYLHDLLAGTEDVNARSIESDEACSGTLPRLLALRATEETRLAEVRAQAARESEEREKARRAGLMLADKLRDAASGVELLARKLREAAKLID